MVTILLVILLLMLIGALPIHPYTANWGYYPGGAIGIILIVLLVLMLAGRL